MASFVIEKSLGPFSLIEINKKYWISSVDKKTKTLLGLSAVGVS